MAIVSPSWKEVNVCICSFHKYAMSTRYVQGIVPWDRMWGGARNQSREAGKLREEAGQLLWYFHFLGEILVTAAWSKRCSQIGCRVDSDHSEAQGMKCQLPRRHGISVGNTMCYGYREWLPFTSTPDLDWGFCGRWMRQQWWLEKYPWLIVRGMVLNLALPLRLVFGM